MTTVERLPVFGDTAARGLRSKLDVRRSTFIRAARCQKALASLDPKRYKRFPIVLVPAASGSGEKGIR